MNAFAARLTVSGIIDLKHMAVWALSTALEDAAQDSSSPSVNKLDVWVPAAAQWILHAGRVISNTEEELGPITRGGRLWKGTPGFSKERWDFWKARFGWVQEQSEPSDETKKIAGEAVAAMESV